jgi:hypothetical protein
MYVRGWIAGKPAAENQRIEPSSRWLRRTNQDVLELDLRLAGKGHCGIRRWRLFFDESHDL